MTSVSALMGLVLPMLKQSFNEIPSKILKTYKNIDMIPEFIWKDKQPRRAKKCLKNREMREDWWYHIFKLSKNSNYEIVLYLFKTRQMKKKD